MTTVNLSVLEMKNYSFLITECPTDANCESYVKALVAKNCTTLVRACDPSYDTKPMQDAGISIVELAFQDGDPPPASIVNSWLDLVEEQFKPANQKVKKSSIAVHCVAGLGRAPVLVAIALVEAGMSPVDAISFIRKRRRGAINARQLKYIESYKRTRQTGSCCVIC